MIKWRDVLPPLQFFCNQPGQVFTSTSFFFSMVTSILTTIVLFYLLFIHSFDLGVPLIKIRHIFYYIKEPLPTVAAFVHV